MLRSMGGAATEPGVTPALGVDRDTSCRDLTIGQPFSGQGPLILPGKQVRLGIEVEFAEGCLDGIPALGLLDGVCSRRGRAGHSVCCRPAGADSCSSVRG